MRGTRTRLLGGILPTRKALRLPIAFCLILSIALLSVFTLAVAIVKIEPFFRHREPAFDGAHPTVGELAPDFTLTDLRGESFHLADRLGQRLLVIEFGSLT